MERYIKLETLNPLATPPLTAGSPPSPDPFAMAASLAHSDELEPLKIGHDATLDSTKGASAAERDFVMGVDEAQQEKMRKRACEGGKKGMGPRRAARLDGTRIGPGKKL